MYKGYWICAKITLFTQNNKESTHRDFRASGIAIHWSWMPFATIALLRLVPAPAAVHASMVRSGNSGTRVDGAPEHNHWVTWKSADDGSKSSCDKWWLIRLRGTEALPLESCRPLPLMEGRGVTADDPCVLGRSSSGPWISISGSLTTNKTWRSTWWGCGRGWLQQLVPIEVIFYIFCGRREGCLWVGGDRNALLGVRTAHIDLWKEQQVRSPQITAMKERCSNWSYLIPRTETAWTGLTRASQTGYLCLTTRHYIGRGIGASQGRCRTLLRAVLIGWERQAVGV